MGVKAFLGRSQLFSYAIVIAIVLSGCSPGVSPSAFPSGGFAVEVPVLWFSTDTNGTEVGGVEATQVWTGASRTSGFALDLTGIQAQGAGDAWRAASASAAAVATLISGVDPSSLNIKFHVSSPIDGPSAGAILTAGILASMRHIPLKTHATMTGTISPDGSIGVVGGVFSKVAAAAGAGFTTVVIPAGNEMSRDPVTSQSVDMVAYGATRGITVVPVTQLAEAFLALTGQSLLGAPTPSSSSSTVTDGAASLEAQRALNVTGLVTKTAALLAATPDAEASTLADETQSAMAKSDYDLASGLARESYLAAWRRHVESQVQQAALAARVTSVLTRSHSVIAKTTGLANITDSQFASMPELLLEVVTAQATLESLKETLPAISTEADLMRAVDILADQEAAIDVFFPLDLNLFMLVRGSKEVVSANPLAFLSNYTNFLVSAGEANMTYLHSVLQAPAQSGGPSLAALDTSYPILVGLHARTQAIQTRTEALPQELSQAAYGLALYVGSAALVSEAQGLSLFNSGIGQTGDLSENTAATSASISAALTAVTTTSHTVEAEGWDPGYPVAQAQAGAAFARNQISSTSSTDSLARGLQRLWAASIAVQLMKAAPE